MILIQDFLWIKIKNEKFLFVKSHNTWNEVVSDNYIAIVNSNVDSNEGIEILFNKFKGKSYIKIDSFGTTPCFEFDANEINAITTDLGYLFDYLQISPEYSIESLKRYFALGYNAIDNHTLYKNVRFLSPGASIDLDSSKQDVENIDLYGALISDVKPTKIVSSLLSSIKQKFQGVDLNEVVFLMTGGKDSLLGALLVKSAIGDVDSATFGFENSKDNSLAKKRHSIIFKSTSHYSFDISDFKITDLAINSYVKSLFGYGPFSSIYYDEFLFKLSSIGKKYVIFSDHFECTRKVISDTDHFLMSYSTPESVVKKYFSKSFNYSEILGTITNDINFKYKSDPYYEFYFYDRYIRASYYKNVLTRKSGMTKVTLVNDKNFLRLNHSYLREKNDFSYDSLMEYLLLDNKLELYKDELEFNQKPTDASIPIKPLQDLKNITDEFISLLKIYSNSEIMKLFNSENIATDLLGEKVDDKSVWFLLRLFQVLKGKSLFDKKYIVCDIDNTVADQYQRLLGCINSEGQLDISKAYSVEMVAGDKVLPGAVDAINKFKHYGFKIVWLSARKQSLEAVTNEWLKAKGFPVDELIIVEKLADKIPIINSLSPFLVIDDCMYNQHNLEPRLATDFIASLENFKINLHIFKNDWDLIVKKYL
jgi:hypothetical protein